MKALSSNMCKIFIYKNLLVKTRRLEAVLHYFEAMPICNPHHKWAEDKNTCLQS